MSVLIKGMEMPKSCRECEWCVHTIPGDKYICYRMKRAVIGVCETDIETVNVCCPLVPVPDHGRLIDADALMLKIQDYIEEYGWETDEHGWHNEKWCAMKEAEMAINDAETVLDSTR